MMKGQKGITLVALIITIIVMLILVGVSISVALNGGLFDKADEAGDAYKAAADRENAGQIIKDENGEYISINDVIDEEAAARQ